MAFGCSKILLILLAISIGSVLSVNRHGAEVDDNEFAEFEDLGDEEEELEDGVVEPEDEDEVFFDDDEFVDEEEDDESLVMDDEFEDEDTEEDVGIEDEDEFEHFKDNEEFENFEGEKPSRGKGAAPDLEIAKVPVNFSNNWNNYYLEIMMLAGIAAYILNYVSGKSKNQRLATAWFNRHKELLESNFALVGDDGTQAEVPSTVKLLKESENQYCLWCTGRAFCEGMLVELKFLKRQDLVSVLAKMMKPGSDQVKVTVTMNKEDMENVVLFLGKKKIVSRMQKDMYDLSLYCNEKRGGEKFGLSQSFVAIGETGEAMQGVLDTKVSNCLSENEDMLEYLHFSDQYCGPKPSADEEQPTELPTTKKVLIFVFNVRGNGSATNRDIEDLFPMMQLVLYCVDKVKRFKLSKDGKHKAERARMKVSESFQKMAHAQRQEAAQARKEEKRKAEKERLLNEEDPEKARKLEDKQYKKDMRKRLNPSMKQVKVRVS
ncbi:Coiled-coil domain-containing protein 47 [Holothuria leucospilota]|uniref:PAT complex subunit CCDC47 n=1 Tax=Holothuria leucospilota TaxID=206669 RepID=A0A9Q0YLV5_HOLLE|nr:Coiled-coil domain-containing protein 47 [Holothuria leucospilota]